VGAVRLNHESDSTGETRQDLKISCSDPAAYRIPVPPFSLREAWRFLIAHALVSRLGVGRSLQAGLCARTPRSARLLRPFR